MRYPCIDPTCFSHFRSPSYFQLFSLAITLWDIPLSRPLKNTLFSLTLPFPLVTLICRKLKPQKPNYSPCSEVKHGQREMLNCAYCYYLKFVTQFSKWLSDLFRFWLSFSFFFFSYSSKQQVPTFSAFERILLSADDLSLLALGNVDAPRLTPLTVPWPMSCGHSTLWLSRMDSISLCPSM